MGISTQLKRHAISRPQISSRRLLVVNQKFVPQTPKKKLLQPFKSAVISSNRVLTANRTRICVKAQQRGNTPESRKQRQIEDVTIAVTAVALTAGVLLAVNFGGSSLLRAFDTWEGLGGLTSGDLLGAFVWSFALYFASPFQLLLLFLGKIETERPSDWVLRKLGNASGLDVDAIDYEAPLLFKVITIAVFMASGIAVSAFLDASLGDGTWSVSSGIGALFGAGLYEVGRPDRLSVEEAKLLESQWQDFKEFADAALVTRGRVHESEVFKAFRARFGKYRTQEALSDIKLRDMVRNWNRQVNGSIERTGTGWYKNLSLRTSTNAFSLNSSNGANSVKREEYVGASGMNEQQLLQQRDNEGVEEAEKSASSSTLDTLASLLEPVESSSITK